MMKGLLWSNPIYPFEQQMALENVHSAHGDD